MSVKYFKIVERVTQRDWYGNPTLGRVEVRGGKKGKGAVLFSCDWSGNLGNAEAWEAVERWIVDHGLREEREEVVTLASKVPLRWRGQ